jgi:hypothetical protein
MDLQPRAWTFDPQRDDSATMTQIPLRPAYALTIHKCVCADTRMVLADGRAVRAAELLVGSHLEIGGEVLSVASVSRPMVQVTTASGYGVTCSPEHRWNTHRGWVETRDLTDDDEIEMATFGPTEAEPEDEVAWWLGAMVGDGTYTKNKDGAVWFATTRQSLGDKWADIAKQIGFRQANWRIDRRGLHACSQHVRQWLYNRCGLGFDKGPDKSVPVAIWEGGPGSWASFLRGLFDTDGSVGRSFVVLTTSSDRMAHDVQLLLLMLNIPAVRKSCRGAKRHYWQLRINAGHVREFERVIGFSDEDKKDRLWKLRPNRVIAKWTGFDRVCSVRHVGVEIPMIDVEVPAPHRVAFGPFVGHNSQGLTLDRAHIDIRAAREPGQAYVALSRLRSLRGLYLKDWIKGVHVSEAAISFYRNLER